jgi:hypothetical protein
MGLFDYMSTDEVFEPYHESDMSAPFMPEPQTFAPQTFGPQPVSRPPAPRAMPLLPEPVAPSPKALPGPTVAQRPQMPEFSFLDMLMYSPATRNYRAQLARDKINQWDKARAAEARAKRFRQFSKVLPEGQIRDAIALGGDIGQAGLEAWKQAQKPQAAKQPNATIEQFLYSQQNPAFGDWLLAQKRASAQNINVGNKGNISASDAARMVDQYGNPVRVPVGMSYPEARAKGWSFGQVTTAEEAKTEAATRSTLDLLNRVEEIGRDTKEDLGIFGVPGVIESYRSGANMSNALVDTLMDKAGYKKTVADVEMMALTENISNQMLQALRGAAVGPAEQERVDKQLPRVGQPKDVFWRNVELSKQNLANIKKYKREARGTNPEVTVPPDDEKYEYRMGPNGKVQRRAK